MTQMLTQIVLPATRRLKNLISQINRRRRTRPLTRTTHADSVRRARPVRRHSQQSCIRLRKRPQRGPHHKSTTRTPHWGTLNHTNSARVASPRARRHRTSQLTMHTVLHTTEIEQGKKLPAGGRYLTAGIEAGKLGEHKKKRGRYLTVGFGGGELTRERFGDCPQIGRFGGWITGGLQRSACTILGGFVTPHNAGYAGCHQ